MSGTQERVEIRAPSGRVAAEFTPYSVEAARALEADLGQALGRAVDFGSQGRALFATDASNYRQVPIGVVTPRSREEVVETVRLCRRHAAPIVARGGGTSLAGQACNVAVVIDFSRYLDRIVALDPEARLACVEPGCILDTLRDAAEKHHLTFGPDPSTHNRNTLGGMIGNNSCGVHSVMAGRTSDNVERMTILTYDGEIWEVGPTPAPELDRIVAGGGRRGEAYAGMRDLIGRYGALIERRYPDIPRLVSGFENLDALLPGRDFNVASALVGTEGTCALVLDATLRLVPSPPCRALAVLGFDDIFLAADAVPEVLALGPIGIEGFDDLLFKYVGEGHAGREGLKLFPQGKGWLIVETGGDTLAEARQEAERIAARMKGRCNGVVICDPRQQRKIWDAREGGLGATAMVPDKPESWEGWEDAAVPREQLGNYLRDFKALMHRHGYESAVYGHFGDGLVHCRINFDLRTEAGLANWRDFLGEAAQLVTSYGGSLSGEHGDGQARAELLETMYGPELVQCFREFKAIWDPRNRMNPGKAIDPFPVDANLRLGPGYRPPQLDTHFAYEADHGSFAHATIRCVGVGACRRLDAGDEVMCPSYMATREEKHSTRGRAHLLHEMVRGEVIKDGWESREVEDALSLCLACKGCRRDCPVSVDMATYKAEFRSHHYKHRLRPRSAYSMGFIHKAARLAEPAPWLANFLTRTPGVSALTKWIGGVHPKAELPAFARRSFRRWTLDRGTSSVGGDRILLWPDTFNNYFRPETAIAATRVLESAGYSVAIPPRPLCCGRPLYDWGFLDQAKALWEESFVALKSEIEQGTPIIGLEPACTSAFKDELTGLFPKRAEAKRLSEQVVHFTDFVAAHFDRFPEPRTGGRALVQAHCHHHAVIGFEPEMALLERLHITTERPPQGCCGMAGAFGFAKETHDVATAIGERVLLPAVREAPDDSLILADGFSCREQIERTGRRTRHIAELLAERMLDVAV
ncbi:FAD-binding and (Fe-S)-binding domain-containing protein [Sphingosinicella humi]|uniref:FAD-binding and (Fe-S)-binding domain-containing protein n=1 Tax=Allosphingosinicella humi TaxID=2068657 RepID=UPI0013048AB7|nr:FAD-binding and (Fe-S)-binding domain-containing protein [Sphingosinicella humi]